jgi:carboxyl-terminal processing protease
MIATKIATMIARAAGAGRRARWRRAAAAALLATAACAGAPPPPSNVPAPPPASSSPAPASPAVQPPAFVPSAGGASAGGEARDRERTETRRAILDAAWRLVRDKHYDPTLGGLDWNAVRARYEPLALAAPGEPAFYRTLNQMIGELGQSHMMISGPGAGDDDTEQADDAAPASPAGAAAGAPTALPASDSVGDPGLTVRVIEGRPTITRVRPGSPAEQAGLRPGFVVTHIGGRELRAGDGGARPLRPVEERFAIRRQALHRLTGPAGTKVSVRYLDNDDRPGEVLVARERPSVAPIQLGHLPPLYPEVHVEQRGDVGILSFNVFLLQPVLADVKRAVAGFRARHVRALIIDLRGNPGGQGAMAIPVASQLVSRPVALGTLQFRGFSQHLEARPEMNAVPFNGPVAILTDEGTASTSEMFAAGLQEAGRAVVVGDVSLGAVLPSVVEALPGGAVMQYVVADFRTPKGVLLEGRGVQPDRRVIETRAGLKTGRDPVLDAALVAVKAARPAR